MRFLVFAAIGLLLAGCSTQSSDAPVALASPTNQSDVTTQTSEVASQSTAENSTVNAPSADASSLTAEGPAADAGFVPIIAGAATLSPSNTRIQFVGTHVGPKPDPMARTGVFTKFNGKAEMDPATKALKWVAVDIMTASLETPINKLTNHLRSPDFFDVREYPTARFESTTIGAADGDGNVPITGMLTLLKSKKELKFPAKVTVNEKGLSLVAELTIDRTQHGLTGLVDRVNKEVTLNISVGTPTAAQ